MTTSHALIAFTIAAALLTITPGLDTALVLRTSAVEGPRHAILAAAGINCGLYLWALAVSVGLGALLTVSHVAYDVLRVAGAAYLVYLGARIFARAGTLVPTENSLAPGLPESTLVPFSERPSRWFARGFLTNILNPKVGIFYVTFLPQFIPAGARVTSFSVALASIHVTENTLWFALLISATAALSTWLRRPRVAKAIDRTTGGLLIGFGVALLFEKSR
jgi:threonine/homoserine/homoserine lactone efflux protein